MQVVSVNVGMPREVTWRGSTYRTGIYKEPVTGAVRVHRLGLDGDGQANLKFHGGIDKAVYAYAAEHYDFWQAEMPDLEFPFGAFGENLTVEGLFEDTIHIGDRFRVGTVELEAAEPRLPCKMLRVRFDNDEIENRFMQSRRTGIYCRVVREGMLEAGDVFRHANHDSDSMPITEIARLHTFDRTDRHSLCRILQVASLSDGWNERFRKQLENLPEDSQA